MFGRVVWTLRACQLVSVKLNATTWIGRRIGLSSQPMAEPSTDMTRTTLARSIAICAFYALASIVLSFVNKARRGGQRTPTVHRASRFVSTRPSTGTARLLQVPLLLRAARGTACNGCRLLRCAKGAPARAGARGSEDEASRLISPPSRPPEQSTGTASIVDLTPGLLKR